MKRLLLSTCAVSIVLFACNGARADYLDVFLATAQPMDPQVNLEANVTWPPGWEEITLPYDDQIPAGGSIWIGLENLHQKDFVKTVTVVYDALDDIRPVGITNTRAGYPAAFPGVTVWDSLEVVASNPPLHRVWVTGKINPQPSWEWIELKNSATATRAITIVEMSSVCVPEPMALVLVGGCLLATALRRV